MYGYGHALLFVSLVISKTRVSANDGKWHNICATWENTKGSWKLYKDGVVKNGGDDFKKGSYFGVTGTQSH